MNQLKSLFITFYLTAATVIAAYAIGKLAEDGFSLGWTGTVLTTLPLIAMVSGMMLLRRTARTTPNLTVISTLTGLGVALAVFGTWRGENAAAAPLLLAVAGAALYALYVFWYSRFGRRGSPVLATGLPLPPFTLWTPEGNPVSSAGFAGSPALLLFYRGNWCPLCMAQVKEVARAYRELAAQGVTVALISPQPAGHTQRLAARFDVPFRFLVDRDNAAAHALGIAAESGLPAGMQLLGYENDTVLPTVVITDADGKIIFTDQTDNYRVRPEPETFLRVLQANAGAA